MSMENIISQKEKLAALVAASTRKTEVQALLADAKAAWELARVEVILSERRLESETADMERLDKKSLPNLLLTVTGKMEDRRVAEKTEAAEAREAHQAAADRAEELQARVSAPEAELRQLGNCDKDMEAETYLPMLISLAESFTTDVMDIPPPGSLQTVKSTFDGTYTASTLTQIERTEAELEALAERVNRAMEKIRLVRQTRKEAVAKA